MVVWFWFGLLGCVGALAAIVSGIVAVVRIRVSRGRLRGSALAWSGIALGMLQVIAVGFGSIFLVTEAQSIESRRQQRRAEEASQRALESELRSRPTSVSGQFRLEDMTSVRDQLHLLESRLRRDLGKDDVHLQLRAESEDSLTGEVLFAWPDIAASETEACARVEASLRRIIASPVDQLKVTWKR